MTIKFGSDAWTTLLEFDGATLAKSMLFSTWFSVIVPNSSLNDSINAQHCYHHNADEPKAPTFFDRSKHISDYDFSGKFSS
jgi:hypothetical protein